jgi:4-hydroxy-3-polyprenylbenzoate decarboxylase
MNLTIAITGASGAVFGREMLRALEADERVKRVHFVASDSSLRVMAEELGLSGRTGLLEKILGHESAKTIQHADVNIGAAIASGSHPSNGMIVLPCSMGTLAAIANGLADSLIARAADVGAAAAGALRAGDALQQNPPAQHDPCCRGWSHDFPGDSFVL